MGNWIGPRAGPDLVAKIKLLAPAKNQNSSHLATKHTD